jgi:TRAP-type C4-dicarboxylate transport system permease large subunit
MFVPVLFPLTQMAGIDLIHFGVIACVNLCIGLVTPPVGPTLNLSCQMTGCKLEKRAEESVPFLATGLAGLDPQITQSLPHFSKACRSSKYAGRKNRRGIR